MSTSPPREWEGRLRQGVTVTYIVGSILIGTGGVIGIAANHRLWHAQWLAASHLLKARIELEWAISVIGMLVLLRLTSGGFVQWLTAANPTLAQEYRQDYLSFTRLPDGWPRIALLIKAGVFAPISEEILYRAFPLFGWPQAVWSGYATVLAQLLWAIGHYHQTRPRTFLVRVAYLLVSSMVYLTTIVVVLLETHNIFWAVAASMAVHSLHNWLTSLWPGYPPLKPMPSNE